LREFVHHARPSTQRDHSYSTVPATSKPYNMPPRTNTRWPVATRQQVQDALDILRVRPSTLGWHHVLASDAPDVRHPQYDLLVHWRDPLQRVWVQLKVRHHSNTSGIGRVGAKAVRGFGNRDAAGRLTEAIRSALHRTYRRPAAPPGADSTSTTFVATGPHLLLNPPPHPPPSAPSTPPPPSTVGASSLAQTVILLLPAPPRHSPPSPPSVPIASPPPHSTAPTPPPYSPPPYSAASELSGSDDGFASAGSDFD
jgi:hypothetical protein